MPVDPAAIQGIAKELGKLAEKFPVQSKFRGFLTGLSTMKPGDVINGIIGLFKGHKYSEGEWVLGEKFLLYVVGQDIHNRREVPDDVVKYAKEFFTELFGIYVDNIRDLDELKKGPDSYRNYHRDRTDLTSNTAAIDNAYAIMRTLPWNDQAGAWQDPIVKWVNDHDTSTSAQVSQQVDNSINGLLGRAGISSVFVDPKGNLTNKDGQVIATDGQKNTILLIVFGLLGVLFIRKLFR